MKNNIPKEEKAVYKMYKQLGRGVNAKEVSVVLDCSRSAALSKLNSSVKTKSLYSNRETIGKHYNLIFYPTEDLIKRIESKIIRREDKEK